MRQLAPLTLLTAATHTSTPILHALQCPPPQDADDSKDLSQACQRTLHQQPGDQLPLRPLTGPNSVLALAEHRPHNPHDIMRLCERGLLPLCPLPHLALLLPPRPGCAPVPPRTETMLSIFSMSGPPATTPCASPAILQPRHISLRLFGARHNLPVIGAPACADHRAPLPYFAHICQLSLAFLRVEYAYYAVYATTRCMPLRLRTSHLRSTSAGRGWNFAG